MADVFAAHDEQLDTEVAVKILRGAGGAPATLARFRREIALARQIGHENVCRIFDLHFHESTPLLSMELLDGPTLAERLASGGAFSPEGALPILRAIAAGALCIGI
jgi:serine/threonine-protein kinase